METKKIFEYIKGITPNISESSSIGQYSTAQSRQVAALKLEQIIPYLPIDSVAYKIATTTERFSEKQLWVIAFELIKNNEFVAMVANHYAEAEKKYIAKIEAQKEKIAANMAESADILAPIISAKKMSAFGRWLNTYGNPYRPQHFSKKYTQEAVNAFLESLKNKNQKK